MYSLGSTYNARDTGSTGSIKISNEGGHKIFSVVLKEPDLTDRVMDILDLELSEQETIAKVEQLL